ncbi:MAG: hypothetical protein K6F82_06195 [Sphaerochaetaceae bacterium]|nr:hypothetical protein [Sphaerochaetaceae bacterium]
MKKLFLLILLSALFLSAVFAGDNAISFSVRPYGLQIATSSIDTQDPVVSTYGIGAEVVYSRYVTDSLFLESGISWDTFLLPDDREAFNNILFFGGLGYSLPLSDSWSLKAHADAGADLLVYMEKTSWSFTVLTGLDAAYLLKDNLYLDFGCDASFGFNKKDSTNYVKYRVLPKVGLNFEF